MPETMLEASYRGVVLNEAGVEERRDGHRVVFVPRPEVRSLRFERGWRAERPILQLAFAAAFLVGGAILSVMMLLEWRHGTRLVMVGLGTLAFGVVVALLALRRGAFIRVDTANGSRKLLFDGPVTDGEVGELLHQGEKLGYQLARS